MRTAGVPGASEAARRELFGTWFNSIIRNTASNAAGVRWVLSVAAFGRQSGCLPFSFF